MKRLAVFVAISILTAGMAMADGTFTVVAEGNATAIFDINPDGTAAAGTDYGQVIRWTEAGGTEWISPSEYLWTHTAGISDDGTRIVSSVEYGSQTPRQFGPAVWTEGIGWEILDTLYVDPPYAGGDEWSFGSGYDISGDGSTVCGLVWHPGYRASGFSWTADGGIVDLGRPVDRSARATTISANGQTIVGFYEHETNGSRRPARWVDNGTTDLFLGEATWGEANGASSDGSVITGQVGFEDNPGYGYAIAFTWSETEGYRDLGIMPGQSPEWSQSMGMDVSDNGIVVGWSGELGPWGVLEPFVWTENDGMVNANNYLADNGVVVPGNLELTSIQAISADGSTIGGQALNLDTYAYVAWIAKITPSTFDADIEGPTDALALPADASFKVDVLSLTDTPMSLHGAVHVQLCNGVVKNNIRQGTFNLLAGDTRTFTWNMNIPAYGSTCGCDLLFTLAVDNPVTTEVHTATAVVSTTCEK